FSTSSAERGGNRFDRRVDVVVRDVEVRDRTHDGRVHGGRHEHAALLHALDRTAAVGTNVDLDEVRLHLVEVDADARLRETFGKAASTRVVVDDAVDVVVERIQRCRCDDPRLAHRAPEVVLAATRL